MLDAIDIETVARTLTMADERNADVSIRVVI